MNDALENLVTVLENLETIKRNTIELAGGQGSDEGIGTAEKTLVAAAEATHFALQAMRLIIQES
jgi:hypothetical protein